MSCGFVLVSRRGEGWGYRLGIGKLGTLLDEGEKQAVLEGQRLGTAVSHFLVRSSK